MQALIAAQNKKQRLHKQQKLLKHQEQQVVDESSHFIEEIEALEAIESINQEVRVLEDSLMPSTSTLD
jgi:hypothetical protein